MLTLGGPLGCIAPEPPLDHRDQDLDGTLAAEDCDDLAPDVYPGAPERCDGVDEDCDGEVDESAGPRWYVDADGDGWGSGEATRACFQVAGRVNRDGDCDDTDAEVSPEASERCDDQDDDCDEEVDEMPVDGLTAWRDVDGDGYGDPDVSVTTCALGDGLVGNAEDCQDSDASVNPEGQERCDDDDRDEDCDGLVDDADPDAVGQTRHYRDRDGDGVGASAEWISACDAVPNYVAEGDDCDDTDSSVGGASTVYQDEDEDGYGLEEVERIGCDDDPDLSATVGDCDDDDPDQHPAATEIWYDGVDQDCDEESDYDADGDGFDDVSWGGEDCDDNDAFWRPGAPVPGFPGDWDCDSVEDLAGLSWTADDVVLQMAGYALANLGDTDGDGLDDVAVGAPDLLALGEARVLLLLGPLSAASLEEADGVVLADGYRGLGVAVAPAGDVDGDGLDDLLFGARTPPDSADADGAAFLWLAPLSDTQGADDADLHVEGGGVADRTGAALAMGDLSGDGPLDLVVGAPDWVDGALDRAGRVKIYTFEGAVSTLAAELDGAFDQGQLGSSLDARGDLDGDGQVELVIGEPRGDGKVGHVWVAPAPLDGVASIVDVGVSIAGTNADDGLGAAVDASVDVDGDGYDDLLVGSPGWTEDSSSAVGAAWLFLGPIAESASASTYEARYLGDSPGLALGASVAFVGDVNGDGEVDLALGAPGASGTEGGEGEVWIFCDSRERSFEHDDACALLRGPLAGSALGTAVVGVSEREGDGTPEVLTGGPLAAGGALTLLGGGL